MKESEKDYYAARLKAEIAAAEAATDEHARRVHEELAEEYRRLIENGGAAEAAE